MVRCISLALRGQVSIVLQSHSWCFSLSFRLCVAFVLIKLFEALFLQFSLVWASCIGVSAVYLRILGCFAPFRGGAAVLQQTFGVLA